MIFFITSLWRQEKFLKGGVAYESNENQNETLLWKLKECTRYRFYLYWFDRYILEKGESSRLSENFPKSIQVNIFPYLVPMTSRLGEKYVRSEANNTTEDNLLKLPRE